MPWAPLRRLRLAMPPAGRRGRRAAGCPGGSARGRPQGLERALALQPDSRRRVPRCITVSVVRRTAVGTWYVMSPTSLGLTLGRVSPRDERHEKVVDHGLSGTQAPRATSPRSTGSALSDLRNVAAGWHNRYIWVRVVPTTLPVLSRTRRPPAAPDPQLRMRRPDALVLVPGSAPPTVGRTRAARPVGRRRWRSIPRRPYAGRDAQTFATTEDTSLQVETPTETVRRSDPVRPGGATRA